MTPPHPGSGTYPQDDAQGRSSEDAPVALVTGSTRRVGLAIARRLAEDGYRIALNYHRDEAAAERALDGLRRVGARAMCVQADVTEASGAESLIDTVAGTWGRLDVVVNNVGPMIERSASETTPDQWRRMVAGNADSAVYVLTRALPHLRRSAGRVVNMGSLNVELARGADNHAAYNAAKAALVVMTRSWARSEGVHGVRVNMVSPGIIDTAGMSESARKRWEARIPLGRLGRPEEVAETVSFLVGPRASYISGAVLTVSGGLWA